MKKLSVGIINLLLIISILSLYILEPMAVKAASSASTLAELRQELKQLQAQKQSNEKKKEMTQSQINQKNKDIANVQGEIKNSEAKIEEATNNIKTSEQKISEYEAKTEEVMAFYQLMMGENSYLEFVTDSSSMTELIMRIDAVEQLIKYNQDQLVTLEDLIKDNEQKQVELKKYQNELNQNIDNYEKKISELETEKLALSDISVGINEEIKLQQAQIKNFEQMGCGENENLDVCVARIGSNGWLKPVPKGRINSLFGYRNVAGQSSNHSGIDIGISEGTEVLSSTVGTVITTFRTNCGGNQVYVQSYVDGKPYVVLYAHLKSISVSAGQQINQQTRIGYSGGYSTSTLHGGYDKCTTGAHLHVSVSQTVYKNYSNFVAHLINPPGYPKTKGAYFYSRTQWFD